jgi:hypothetical protein
MKHLVLRISLALSALAAAVSAPAQLSAGNQPQEPIAPYTVEFRMTHVQTLAGGGTITRETKEIMARDSQGRTLHATTTIPSDPDQPQITSTFVNDPVASTQANWNSRNRRAHVTKMPPPDQRQGCWSTASGNMTFDSPGRGMTSLSGIGTSGSVSLNAPPPLSIPPADGAPASVPRPAAIRPEREDLGSDTILGVEVRGTRITRTVPAGREGNDVPLVTTSEIWSAPRLGLTLREVTDSEQSGKTTREAVNLDLSEPDPSLFQPPEGYEIDTDEMHPVACQPPR